MPHRPKLFAGIELDERSRALCASVAARLEAQNFQARFEDAAKMHVTLAFLGWVDAKRVEEIQETFATAAAACKPFDLTLDKLGAFPNERNPHIVWVGAREQKAFRESAGAVRAAFAELGFTFTKGPVAHVTIARVKANGVHLPLLDIKPATLRVKTLTLFESLPAGKTTRYEVRFRAPLSA